MIQYSSADFTGFKSIEPRRFKNNYGDLMGMLITFRNIKLRPVQIFKELPFASVFAKKGRFCPPHKQQAWSDKQISVFTSKRNYGVCKQLLLHEGKLVQQFPLLYIERMQRKSQFIVFQTEDCLFMNLYIPTIGE